ncbi:alpha-2-macroglobulin-like protein 1 [Oratosquilla oratoria]|uniref:alpha-2-macroglobulin-like protein 1 n=1 Tax=Oratosquilla oratoria TaxID=337810 RepID=UPI003F7746C8
MFNLLHFAFREYLIVTPKKWHPGVPTKVCVFVTRKSNHEDKVTIGVDSFNVTVAFTHGGGGGGGHLACAQLALPEGEGSRTLRVFGSVAGEDFEDKRPIWIISLYKIFIQTDKFLYRTGQDVEIRLLTVGRPNVFVQYDNYDLVWVEAPGGTRIQQWQNVDNSQGLVHLKFRVASQALQGTYTIFAQTTKGKSSQHFKVKDYVLPTFSVSLSLKKYILGTDSSATFTVCATYTFGQPVSGEVTLNLKDRWSSYQRTITTEVSGCEDILASLEPEGQMLPSGLFRLSAVATVEETGTGTTQEASLNVPIHRSVLQFKGLKKDYEKYAMPGLPYQLEVRPIDEPQKEIRYGFAQKLQYLCIGHGYRNNDLYAQMMGTLLVSFPDNAPAPNETMQVCVHSSCKNYMTDAQGILRAPILVYSKEQSIGVTVRSLNYDGFVVNGRTIMRASIFEETLEIYISPSSSSLAIHRSNHVLRCSSGQIIEEDLTVYLASPSLQNSVHIVTLGVSRSQIQYHSSQNLKVTFFDLKNLSESDLGNEMLVVNVNSDSSIVTGKYLVSVTVGLEVADEASPGPAGSLAHTSGTHVRAGAAAAALEVEVMMFFVLRETGEVVAAVSEYEVEECLSSPLLQMSWSVPRAQPGDMIKLHLEAEAGSICGLGKWSVCFKKVLPGPNLALRPLLDRYDLLLITRNGVTTAFTDWWFTTGPSSERPNTEDMEFRSLFPFPKEAPYTDALEMFDNVGLHVITDLFLDAKPCPKESCGDTGTSATYLFAPTPKGKEKKDGPKSGPQEPRDFFPETWLWDIVVMSPSGHNETEVKVPDTITEWVGEAVCVHPKTGVGLSGEATFISFLLFFVDLKLPPSVKRGETFETLVSVFNFLEHNITVSIPLFLECEYVEVLLKDNPDVEVDGNARVVLCVPAKKMVVHRFWFKAKTSGHVQIAVTATDVFDDALDCEGTVRVNKTDTVIRVLSVRLEGVPMEIVHSEYICEGNFREEWMMSAPADDAINDTISMKVMVSGELLGPSIENLRHLIRKPYGCGEQNMINFAPNIFILQYLWKTHQLTDKAKEDLITFIKEGYQRELLYKLNDGSFSAFGNSDKVGSTSLTAFVLKSFAKAKEILEVIFVDDLKNTMEWLEARQLSDGGCFESLGRVIHKDLLGGVGGASLSSYALIALLEAFTTNSVVVDRALECLNNTQSVGAYQLALKAYAFSLASFSGPSTTAAIEEAYILLKDKSISKELYVEGVSYLILAMHTYDSDDYSREIMNLVQLLSKEMNGQGGFHSTQDTIVALQALAMSSPDVSNGTLSSEVSVFLDPLNDTFFINKDNRLLLQSTDSVAPPPPSVTVQKTGNGCVLVQAVLSYNVPEKSNGSINIFINKNCNKTVEICLSCTDEDPTNMAVMEVFLESGYVPHGGLSDYDSANVEKLEVTNSGFNVYFKSLSQEETCVTFQVRQGLLVQNTGLSHVEAYDYYAAEGKLSVVSFRIHDGSDDDDIDAICPTSQTG